LNDKKDIDLSGIFSIITFILCKNRSLKIIIWK